jgi:hypothetical protein
MLHKYNMEIHEAQKGRHGLLRLAFLVSYQDFSIK